jgi:hypothetical protein
VIPGLSRLRSRSWLVWAVVLPALALRALVPAGFMPMRDEQGRLALMLCPGEAPDPHARHHHHHHPGSPADGNDGSASGHTLCPYALSAGPALAYSFEVQAPPALRVEFAALPRHADPLVDTLLRVQTARAPPIPHQV